MVDFDEIESILGYQFNERELLVKALTTPAYAKHNDLQSYEHLEFLGDAVLKFLLSVAIHDLNVTTPGELTRLRSLLENNTTLSLQAREFRLQEQVQSLVPITKDDMGILADVYEALAGAVYLDSGRKLSIARQIFIDPLVERLDDLESGSLDGAKNRFIEAVQHIFGFTPEIEIEYVESGPDHEKRFGCRGLKVIDPSSGKVVRTFNIPTKSDDFKRKKDADKDLMQRAYETWRDANFT